MEKYLTSDENALKTVLDDPVIRIPTQAQLLAAHNAADACLSLAWRVCRVYKEVSEPLMPIENFPLSAVEFVNQVRIAFVEAIDLVKPFNGFFASIFEPSIEMGDGTYASSAHAAAIAFAEEVFFAAWKHLRVRPDPSSFNFPDASTFGDVCIPNHPDAFQFVSRELAKIKPLNFEFVRSVIYKETIHAMRAIVHSTNNRTESTQLQNRQVLAELPPDTSKEPQGKSTKNSKTMTDFQKESREIDRKIDELLRFDHSETGRPLSRQEIADEINKIYPHRKPLNPAAVTARYRRMTDSQSEQVTNDVTKPKTLLHSKKTSSKKPATKHKSQGNNLPR